MTQDNLDSEFQASADERQLLDWMQNSRASSSQIHDHGVLAAAREASNEIAGRTVISASIWRMPVSIAASFVLGLGVMFLSLSILERNDPAVSLGIPADFTRGGELLAADVPVEDADAHRWREYIEELIYNGEYTQAEVHLRRFNELHPDYSSD